MAPITAKTNARISFKLCLGQGGGGTGGLGLGGLGFGQILTKAKVKRPAEIMAKIACIHSSFLEKNDSLPKISFLLPEISISVNRHLLDYFSMIRRLFPVLEWSVAYPHDKWGI